MATYALVARLGGGDLPHPLSVRRFLPLLVSLAHGDRLSLQSGRELNSPSCHLLMGWGSSWSNSLG